MPEKVLGIDISDGLLKAVLISHGIGGGNRVELAETIDISAAGGLPEAMNQLRGRMNFRQVTVHYSLPPETVSFHTVKLPFREEKKIGQTIAFELETLLPRGIADYLLDYNIITQSKHSEILAAAVPRSVVQEKIALLGENPPEIRIVTIGALAVVSKLSINKTLGGSALLLDIGNRETVAVFVSRGKVRQMRCYPFGVASLQHERQEGGTGRQTRTDLNGHIDEATGRNDACERFFQDLKSTFEFLKWRGIVEEGVSHIFLTGSGSIDPGIQEGLTRFFGIPVEMVDLASTDGVVFTDTMNEVWIPSLMDQALALAMYGYKKGQGFNFPIGDQKQKERQEKRVKTVKWGVAVFSVAVLLVALDNYLDYRYARLRLDNLKKEIQAVFKSSAPDVTRIVDPIQQFKVKIAETKKITAGIRDVASGSLVLDILKDISNLAPPATEFLIASFNLDEDQLVIKGTAKNFDAVDTIKKELSKSSYLQSVQIGTTNLLKQSERVEFDLRMTAKR